MEPRNRRVSLFVFACIVNSVAFAIGVWITIWCFLPPPQPSTPAQLRRKRHQGPQPALIILGVFTSLWLVCLALNLVYYSGQIITWRTPLSWRAVRLEHTVWNRVPVAVGLLLICRLVSGFIAMVANVRPPSFSSLTPGFDPSKRVAFGVGWGVSIILHIAALLTSVAWVKDYRAAAAYFTTEEQTEIAMHEAEDAQRAEARLAALRAQHS